LQTSRNRRAGPPATAPRRLQPAHHDRLRGRTRARVRHGALWREEGVRAVPLAGAQRRSQTYVMKSPRRGARRPT